MASSQSMLEQILSAALSSSGVRNAAPGGAPAEGAGNLDDVLGGLLGGLASGAATQGGQPGSPGAGGLGANYGLWLGGPVGLLCWPEAEV
jgi:hypothetical protein